MVVNFEFLDDEPIENLITCMNFKIDRVVFFGYHKTIEEQKDRTEKFLQKYCGVQTVVFHALSQHDLQSTLNSMRKEVQYERSQKNQIYFDITGGEDLILVAFGMLSKEFEMSMHMYDVTAGKLIELDKGACDDLSKSAGARTVPMTLDMLVEMRGGRINNNLHKGIKDANDPEFMDDAEKIYQVARQNWDCWNPFSDFLRNKMASEDLTSLQVSLNTHMVLDALAKSKTKLNDVYKLNAIIDSLAAEGILLDVNHSDGFYGFRFKNQAVKECLWEGGSVLELHIYREEVGHSSDCRVGVHLDWDGIIHDGPGVDVLNEIDVLSLNGNVPTFISCKSGKMGADASLHALYELETVAERFGGKYARKVLVSAKNLEPVYFKRAAEMGIEVRVLS